MQKFKILDKCTVDFLDSTGPCNQIVAAMKSSFLLRRYRANSSSTTAGNDDQIKPSDVLIKQKKRGACELITLSHCRFVPQCSEESSCVLGDISPTRVQRTDGLVLGTSTVSTGN